jgi:cobalamin-dependent methionine synthase I
MTVQPKIYHLQDIELQIPQRKIFHRLGYKSRSAPISEAVSGMVKEQEQNLKDLLHTQILFRILDYTDTNQHLIFEHAEKVAICLCTIGDKLEKTSAELIKDNEMLKGFVLDSFGSEAAEELAIQADRKIVQHAREMGLWPSKRFSPGYGIWDIREQSYIFTVLPAHEIGVRLTDTFMMVPRKSVSFRINFYRDQKLTTRSFR